MKIGYMSDIHFEFQDRNVSKFLDSIERDDLDYLLLAGDISTLDHRAQDRFIVNTHDVIKQCYGRFRCPVFAVNGNHEFYGLNMEDYSPNQVYTFGDCVYGNRYIEILENNVALIAATLWTDYCLMGEENQRLAMLQCGKFMADHRFIKYKDKIFTPDMAYDLHLDDKKFIKINLEYCMEKGFKPIILTHHVPHSIARNPVFPIDLVSSGFYSDCNDLIELAEQAGCLGWIFGHHHWCIEDYKTFKFPLLSAQLGYRKEDTGWKGLGVLEI